MDDSNMTIMNGLQFDLVYRLLFLCRFIYLYLQLVSQPHVDILHYPHASLVTFLVGLPKQSLQVLSQVFL